MVLRTCKSKRSSSCVHTYFYVVTSLKYVYVFKGCAIVTYDEFIDELGKAGLSVRGFAELLSMRPNSVSNYARRGAVPSHLAVIAALLAEMHVQGISYDVVFSRLDLSKKKARGGASVGKFGGDKQQQLELRS